MIDMFLGWRIARLKRKISSTKSDIGILDEAERESGHDRPHPFKELSVRDLARYSEKLETLIDKRDSI